MYFFKKKSGSSRTRKVVNPVEGRVPHPQSVSIFPSHRAVPVNTKTNQNLRVGDIRARILSVDHSH